MPEPILPHRWMLILLTMVSDQLKDTPELAELSVSYETEGGDHFLVQVVLRRMGWGPYALDAILSRSLLDRSTDPIQLARDWARDQVGGWLARVYESRTVADA